MAEVAAPKPKTVKPKGEKKETTQALIKEAIVALKERSGSSPAAIKKYWASKGKTLDSALLGRELKKLATKGYLVKVKASFKLSESAKKAPPKPKKKAVKKPVKKATKPKTATAPKVKKVTKKTDKKPAAPKTAAAKATTKKTVKPKKPATKKPATKKVGTKKPSTKTAVKKTKPATKKPATKKTPKKAAAKPAKAVKA